MPTNESQVIELMPLIQEVLEQRQGEAEPENVHKLNIRGVDHFMNGRPDEALQDFLEALRLSGGNEELCAQCLVNMGDWTRRVQGNVQEAFSIFELAEELTTSLVTRSRILSMRAMAWRYSSEHDEVDPKGIEECVACLKQAIALAQEAAVQGESGTSEAMSLAVHRGVGTERWMTSEQMEGASDKRGVLRPYTIRCSTITSW